MLRYATPLVFGLLMTVPQTGAAQEIVTIGVVADGPSFFIDAFRSQLTTVIRQETEGNFDARFPADRTITADWTRPGVADDLQRLLDDREVDLVLAVGAIATQLAAEFGPLPKPVIGMLVLDAGLQGLPLVNGSSGIANFTYLANPEATTNDLGAFAEAVPFDRLAVLVERAYLEAKPALRSELAGSFAQLGINGTVVAAGPSIDLALGAVPSDADAVFVGFLPRVSEADTDRLIQALNARRLPTYTVLGEEWVRRGFLTSSIVDLVGPSSVQRAALVVRMILQGADPATMQVYAPRNDYRTVNLATARATGVRLSRSLLTEAKVFGQRPAGGRPLDLGGAVREAVARNLDLEAQGYAVAAGAQQVRGSRSPLLPQIEFDVDARVIDSDRAAASFGREPQRAVAGSATLVQQLYSEQTWAEYSIEKHLQDGRVQFRDEIRLDVIFEAATAYLNVLRAKAVEDVVRTDLAVSRQNRQLAEIRRLTGAAAVGEVLRWDSEIGRSRQEVIAAHSIRSIAEIRLNRILHRPLEQPLVTDSGGPRAVAAATNIPRLAPYLAGSTEFRVLRDFMAREALVGSPELRQFDATIAAQTRELTATKRAFFVPNLALLANTSNVWAKSGAGAVPPPSSGIVPNDLGWVVGVQLSYPIFQGLARSAAKSQAELDLDDLRTRRNAAADRVEQRVRSAMHRLGASWTNAALAQYAAAAAGENLDLVTEAYATASASITDLVDAQANALLADLTAVNTAIDLLVDLMEVERASGSFSFFKTREEREEFIDRLDAFARNQPADR